MAINDSLFFVVKRIFNDSTRLWLRNEIILSSHRYAKVLRLLKGIFDETELHDQIKNIY